MAIPLPSTFRPAWIPGYPQTENRFDLIRVITDDGIEGWSAGPAVGMERSGLGDLLGQYLIGIDATDIDVVQQRLRELSYLGQRHWWIEPAFWDIVGKLKGTPVYRLLGGRPGRINLYASCGEMKTPADQISAALARAAEGFEIVKIRVHNLDEEADIRLVRETCAAVGDAIKIAVDVNQGWRVSLIGAAPVWDLARAKRFAEVCAEAGVAWIEEPLAMDAYDDLAALTASSPVPITGGELHTGGLPELKMMIERDCYDRYQPDAIFTGGIAQTLRIAELCNLHGVSYTPHTWTNGIGFAVNLQLMGAIGRREHHLEYPIDPPSWTVEARDQILTRPWIADRGSIDLPTTPGLGFEIDLKQLRRHGKRISVSTAGRVAMRTVRRIGPRASLEVSKARHRA